MQNKNALDKLILENGDELYGIVDYVNKKHVYFFDFTNTANPDITLIALVWRNEEPSKRFSIYSTLYFPEFELPRINLIHKNSISDATVDLEVTPKEQQNKHSVKYSN